LVFLLDGKLPRQDSNLNKENQNTFVPVRKVLPANTSVDSPAPLAPPLAPDPDLTRVVTAWPALPEHIRAAILALVGGGDKT